MSDARSRLAEFAGALANPYVLVELALVAASVGAAWAVARALAARNASRGIDPRVTPTWTYVAARWLVVVAPVLLALGLVAVARALLGVARIDVAALDGAIRLIGAYAAVRSGVLLYAGSIGNKSWIRQWEARVALAIWCAVAAQYLGLLAPLIDTLESFGIAAGRSRITVWSILKLLFTLTLFVLVAAWISRWFERRLQGMGNLAPSTRIGIAKFVNALVIGLSILMGLNAAGVDLTALTVLTGAIGLGLGFGLQSIAANFVSGFVLLLDRSIKPGDVISLSGQSGTSTENFGWVQELRGRYVVVRDRDGVEMLVPNQQLISSAVINWSYTDPRIRLKLPVRVSYQDDPEIALRILLEACEHQTRVLRDPPPASRLMHFGESGIDLELRFWISDPQEGVNNVRSEVNRAIWRLFKQHGITIPVAQREIVVHGRGPTRHLD